MQVRHHFELGTTLEKNLWVLGMFNVGPAYLHEVTLLSGEKGCVFAKIKIFLPCFRMLKKISWKQLLSLL